tara:strand:- start:2513 stop:2968 length:456 start_codon:yes stop_codon:yes gene_type:complete
MGFVRKSQGFMKNLTFIFLFNIVLSQNKNNFNPSLLNDPEPLWPEIVNPLTSYETINELNVISDTLAAEIEGFRVQVFATLNRKKVDELQETLLLKYEEKSYIIFEAPNYKLRMGDFLDRKNAENLRKRLAANGYPSSWIVRTRIQPEMKQ